MNDLLEATRAIFKVGDGRGFVACRIRQHGVEHRFQVPRIETGDRDLGDRTGRRLVEYEGILTCADCYLVICSHMNGVVAVADRYRISAKGKYHVIVAVSQLYPDVGAAANKHLIIVSIDRLDYVP